MFPASWPPKPQRFSRKVFFGGLPPDLDELAIQWMFFDIGSVFVDWPHKERSTSRFPPQGYVFLCFGSDEEVRKLLELCSVSHGKYYIHVSTATVNKKLAQVRPWYMSDCECSLTEINTKPDHRLTVFVGGVPRPATALQLAQLMDKTFGNVSQVTIEVDNDFNYPKGAARVSFSSRRSYAAAVCKRFLNMKVADNNKMMEIKPFLVDSALCDACQMSTTDMYCPNLHCLAYFCQSCWNERHDDPTLICHKAMVKATTDRTRHRLRPCAIKARI